MTQAAAETLIQQYKERISALKSIVIHHVIIKERQANCVEIERTVGLSRRLKDARIDVHHRQIGRHREKIKALSEQFKTETDGRQTV